jgi:MATE family multidrug resistance protein
VDTAFVSQLGAPPLAALGVGTVVLTSVFWVFNFLQIGTQTEIGRLLGEGNRPRAQELCGLALTFAISLGVAMIAVGLPLIGRAAAAMGAQGQVLEDSVTYLGIRLLAAPFVLITITAFGALRGLQDMRGPMYIAVGINLLNIALDPILIFGFGPIPALGIAGAAWATVFSQFLGALGSLWAVRSRLGFPSRLHGRDATRILSLGGNLFLRTGLLTAFMLLSSRAATTMGEVPAAAHQAIRAVWIFTAFVLDAYALTAQSLTSYFLGARRLDQARRVARVSCSWGLVTGLALTLLMVAGEGIVTELLVPEVALELFAVGWLICALAQPLNALSFVTDGIHWGTGDFRYLRNAMFLATAFGASALYFLDEKDPHALTTLWLITAGWIAIRAVFGLVRIWPGRNGPLGQVDPPGPSQPT